MQGLLQRIQHLEGALPQTPAPTQQTPPSTSRDDESREPETFADGSNGHSSCARPSTASTDQRERQDAITPSECRPTASAPPPASPLVGRPRSLSADVFPVESCLGLNWFFNGMSIFSEQGRQWVFQRTGQALDSARLSGGIPGPAPRVAFKPSTDLELFGLPDRDTSRDIFAAFFRSALWLAFPVLDRVLFEETLETAYDAAGDSDLLSSPELASARSCVLGALSVACRLKGTGFLSSSVDADRCALRARGLVLRNTGDVSLTTLQAVIMLVSLISPRSSQSRGSLSVSSTETSSMCNAS